MSSKLCLKPVLQFSKYLKQRFNEYISFVRFRHFFFHLIRVVLKTVRIAVLRPLGALGKT